MKYLYNDTKYDMNNRTVHIGDLVEIQYINGGYGQTKIVQGTITSMDNMRVRLDDELNINGAFTYDYSLGKYVGQRLLT